MPRAAGVFAIGTASVEARYRAEELIDVSADRLFAIGARELQKTEAEFTATAKRLDPSKPPLETWRGVLADHPPRGQLVAAAQQTVDELFTFIRAKRLVQLAARD